MSALALLNPLATLNFHELGPDGKCAAEAGIFERMPFDTLRHRISWSSADEKRTFAGMIGT